MSQVNRNASRAADSAYVLTSLYPLGMVPEISSVDVRQPAGQYLLRRREALGEWGWPAQTPAPSWRYLPVLCLWEIRAFVQAGD